MLTRQGPSPTPSRLSRKAVLRETGIEEIGIGAYPEGHPRIPAARLESALDEKIAAATAQGLRVHIV
jgi:methylenetetrahydrofolate reductase (NADPH)